MKTLVIGTLAAATALAAALYSPTVTAAPSTATTDALYVAELHPINVKASGLEAGGEMRFAVHGDRLTIKVSVHGVPPNIEHWQHFHGFADGHAAGGPVAMDIPTDTYPHADAQGGFEYEKTVSLKALQASFGKKFDGGSIDLDHR